MIKEAESYQNVIKTILFNFKILSNIFFILYGIIKLQETFEKKNWELGDQQGVLNLDIPWHNWLVLGSESPNLFCIVLFGIRRLQEVFEKKMRAGRSAGNPQYKYSCHNWLALGSESPNSFCFVFKSQIRQNKKIWILWTQNELAVPGNIQIEDLLLISQPSIFFSNVSWSLIISNKTKQFFFGGFWTQYEPVVPENIQIEVFLLIFQPSIFFFECLL
jgi:hypothetical protein